MAYAMLSTPVRIDQPVSQPVLTLERLSVRFSTGRGEVAAVDDLTLDVAAGECLGVVGESGAGKSQAFLAALGLLAANGRVTGAARFEGRELVGLPERALDAIRGARVGFVFQDPMTSLTPHVVVGDQIAELLVCHRGLAWRAARERACALLERVQITDPMRRMRQYPHELSGGMRQRVMIAIALACEPALVIADEPTTSLDVTVQRQILALLAELKRTQAMALILITHDFGAVAGLADRIAVMRAGRLVESGPVDAVLTNPTAAYTRQLVEAARRMSEAQPQRTMEPGKPLGPGEPGAPGVVATPSTLALQLAQLDVRYRVGRGWGARSEVQALERVSLDVAAGEAVGIVGESGSGKSTLARAALRLIAPRAGRVVWLGTPVQALTQRELRPLRRQLQVVFQDPLASLEPRMTVGTIIAEGLQLHRRDLGPAAHRERVVQSLIRVGLDPQLMTRYPHELSGGQRQRVGIARALVLEPQLLVCDEPVSALDVPVRAQIIALLAALKRELGMSIVLISHDLAVVRQLCERVLVLYLGRMMEGAPAQALYTAPFHPYARQLLDSVPQIEAAGQRSRLLAVPQGEAPSPLAPPSGCVFRTRCAFATDVCRARVPVWEAAASDRWVACHRWHELAPALAEDCAILPR